MHGLSEIFSFLVIHSEKDSSSKILTFEFQEKLC